MSKQHRSSSWPIVTAALIGVVATSCASNPKVRSEFPTYQTATVVETSAAQKITEKENIITSADPVVQPGFLFEMNNMEDRKLNGKFRVDFDGVLKLPYQVNLNTESLRASEVKTKIATSYKKFFQTSTAFSVQLAKREFYVEVRGLVEKPGRYVVSPEESLESIISRAGGLKKERENKELEPRFLRVTKRNKSETSVVLRDYFKSGILPLQFSVSGGDTLVFQVDAPNGQSVAFDSTSIQIMGEVLRPGDLSFKQGADIYYYLHLAGGPAPGANLNEIRIVRGPENNRVIASLDTLEEGTLPVLKAGDIILVPHDKPTKFERGVTTGAGLATIISAIVLLIIAF